MNNKLTFQIIPPILVLTALFLILVTMISAAANTQIDSPFNRTKLQSATSSEAAGALQANATVYKYDAKWGDGRIITKPSPTSAQDKALNPELQVFERYLSHNVAEASVSADTARLEALGEFYRSRGRNADTARLVALAEAFGVGSD